MRFFNNNTYVISDFNNDILTYIKFKRKQKGLTLENACNRVCSTSWLSKFENEEVSANYNYLNGIMINLESNEIPSIEEIQRYYNIFYELYSAYEFDNENKVKLIYNVLEKHSEYLSNSIFLFDFTLIKLLYNSYFKRFEHVILTLLELQDMHLYLNGYQKQFMFHYVGVYELKRGNYERAIDFLLRAKDLEYYSNGLLHYHIADAYNYIRKPKLSLMYSKIASNKFIKQNNFSRNAYCNIINGNSYLLLRWPEKAIEAYDKVINFYNNNKFNIDIISNFTLYKVLIYIDYEDYEKAKSILNTGIIDVNNNYFDNNKKLFLSYLYAQEQDESFNEIYPLIKHQALDKRGKIAYKLIPYIYNRDYSSKYYVLLKKIIEINDESNLILMNTFYKMIFSYLKDNKKYKELIGYYEKYCKLITEV